MIVLDDETWRQGAHALALNYPHWLRGRGRNHYCTSSDDTVWCALVLRGLAVEISRDELVAGEGSSVFKLTPRGVQAVREHPRTAELLRAVYGGNGDPHEWYDVFFGGDVGTLTVCAQSLGKARYEAARDLAYLRGGAAFSWLERVKSARRNYLR